VQYRPGKIMKCGDAGLTSVPTTGVIDLSGDENAAAWREVSQSSLMIPRVEHNLTLLPTGEVLVTGGLRIRTNIATAVRQPQIWNPNTEVWTDSLLLAPDPGNRDYHSTKLLLPDGRILSGGGDSGILKHHALHGHDLLGRLTFDANAHRPEAGGERLREEISLT
jgi:hypothetical protein